MSLGKNSKDMSVCSGMRAAMTRSADIYGSEEEKVKAQRREGEKTDRREKQEKTGKRERKHHRNKRHKRERGTEGKKSDRGKMGEGQRREKST